MSFDTSISSHELSNHILDKNFIIVDCRFDLMKPLQGFIDYQAAHIPGAFYANLDHDLASPITPHTGRHPLPDANSFSKTLARWGVNHSSQVIVYDNAGGSFAVRLWWLLHYYGFENAAVLDGGINQWMEEGLPVDDNRVEDHEIGSLPELYPHSEMLVTTPEMVKIQKSGDYLLIDARTPARYEGKVEPIDAVSGHIPGAVNRFHGTNLNDQGLLKSVDELKLEFQSLIKNYSTDKIIVYCGSGVTSCHHLLAMKKAGIEGVRLYAGSWSEWIRDPNRPIAKS